MYYKIIKFVFFCFTFFVLVTSKNIIPNRSNEIKITKDVLFINGCSLAILPHPYRYRISHQMEQLNAGFLESDEFFYAHLVPNIIRNYRIIIFFRCPWTDNVNKAIKLAKKLNKKVLFDIDDLVIERKYTDVLPFIKTLSHEQKDLYDNGVYAIGKTLKLCQGAITTTEALARELKNYVPDVFINRNVASEEMWKLSEDALKNKQNKNNTDNIIIGYFSGSISHNPDFEMIGKTLDKILKEYKNVKLLILGYLSLPKYLEEYKEKRIINETFKDWRELPKIISNIDINIAPIESNIFNEAKSENKWVEASLVKVPTVASNFGAFKQTIIHNKTGLLCSNINEWYISLKTLINNIDLRKEIGNNAYNVCKKKYNTIYTGRKLANHINSIANKHIGFFLPSLQISGGIYVVLKHASILQDEGWDVDIILPDVDKELYEFQDHIFNLINLKNHIINAQYDIIVATLYSTIYSSLGYYKTKKHIYLVQGYETDFYSYGSFFRGVAEKTYSAPFNIEYITISKWCQSWLNKKYKKKAKYAPNGIDLNNYSSHKRNLNKNKIRILIEGDCNSYYKNIDESFKIIDKLNKDKFEVWYLSYNGKPKDWYRVDKFLSQIPHEKVIEIYEQCDILLKSSWLESFSYPPLEMMATGGYCIVIPNGGNKEYLKDGENCLLYKLGNPDDGVKAIKRLIKDKDLQYKLYKNGLDTAKQRDWKNFKSQILSLYDI